MNKVDQVYVINLDKREDRMKKTKDQLKVQKIKFKRISAVDGETLEHPTKTRGIFRDKYWNKYALGLVKTMKILIEDAIKNNYNNIVVFEDDNQYDYKFTKTFNKYVQNLPRNWELIKLSVGIFGEVTYINNNFFEISRSTGTFAMLINKNGFKKILREVEREDAPLDIMMNEAFPKHHCFYPGLVIPMDTFSNITNEYAVYSSQIKYKRNEFMEYLIDANKPVGVNLTSNMLNFNKQ